MCYATSSSTSSTKDKETIKETKISAPFSPIEEKAAEIFTVIDTIVWPTPS